MATCQSMVCSRPRWTENCGTSWPANSPRGSDQIVLPQVVAVSQLAGADGDLVQAGQQVEGGQFADRMRQGVDADAQWLRTSAAASWTWQAMPCWCSIRASVRPPMPPPAMMIRIVADPRRV